MRKHWDSFLIGGLFVYFALRLVFFAATIEHQAPPDEIDHFPRTLLFSHSAWVPEDSPASHEFGLIGHRPYLYYLLMGKLLHANVFPLSDLVWLRLLNCGLSLITAAFVLGAVRQLTDNRMVHILSLTVATNVLMFTGVSASVNYDNLSNLLAAAAFYFLLAYLRQPRLETLLKFLIALLSGALTKNSFLPLAFILVVVFLVHERRHLLRWRYSGGEMARARRVFFLTALGILIGLNGHLYLTNLVNFHRLIPKAIQVLEQEEAMKYRLWARYYVVNQFETGAVSYHEALAMTEKISNPSNRRRAVNLLGRLRTRAHWIGSLPGPELYPFIWAKTMLSDGLGYRGHRVMRKEGAALYPYLILIFISIFMLIRKGTISGERGRQGRLLVSSAVVVFFYAMVLMWLINYPLFRRYGVPDYVTQGRYMFPVLAPMASVFSFYFLEYAPKRWQPLLALLAATVFLMGDFPFFQTNADPCWFMGSDYESQCLR